MFDLKKVISPYSSFCSGYGNPGASGDSYLVGLVFGIGKTKIELNHDGTSVLESINAFDKAEVENTYMGQINMVIVSSFCGPMGGLVGYDILKSKDLYSLHKFYPEGKVTSGGSNIPVYSAGPMVMATRGLFGTVESKRFPLMPGSIVPCAGRNISEVGPKHIYCGFGVGIAKNHKRDAHLFMEDTGEIPLYVRGKEVEAGYRHKILGNLAESILKVGQNQGVQYKEIFVEMHDVMVQPGEICCALVAAPYFTLAKDAIPIKGGVESLASTSLEAWNKEMNKKGC